MSKSRPFSIYLLKADFDASNALKEDHSLNIDVDAELLPEGATLFVRGQRTQSPWWEKYFGISSNIVPAVKGALVFMPIKEHCFVLSFGHVSHNLKDESYEHDFGLRVTLNCVDPEKLKSTDTLDPGAARRQRTQIPTYSDLTYFDFDQDSTILKSLSGKVKSEYEKWFKRATGSSSLHISSAIPPDDIPELCEKLLSLYKEESYKDTFPGIRNIEPVRDPAVIEKLNEKLLDSFRARNEDLYLTIPDIFDPHDNLRVKFSGIGRSQIHDEVFIRPYYEYLISHDRELNDIGFEDLKKHNLVLTDEDGFSRKKYSIFKSLVFDTTLGGGTVSYHLVEGSWYKVETSYVENLASYLDPLCEDISLPEYLGNGEGQYNENVAANDNSYICLDKSNISPTGQTQIEPCDLYCVKNGHAIFHHVKISTLSAQLSHLFNQGVNAVQLLKSEHQAVDKLKSLIQDRTSGGGSTLARLLRPIGDQKFRVVFAIVTHKDKPQKSWKLPLFSRISLMRNMKALHLMGVKGSYGFIANRSRSQI